MNGFQRKLIHEKKHRTSPRTPEIEQKETYRAITCMNKIGLFWKYIILIQFTLRRRLEQYFLRTTGRVSHFRAQVSTVSHIHAARCILNKRADICVRGWRNLKNNKRNRQLQNRKRIRDRYSVDLGQTEILVKERIFWPRFYGKAIEIQIQNKNLENIYMWNIRHRNVTA